MLLWVSWVLACSIFFYGMLYNYTLICPDMGVLKYNKKTIIMLLLYGIISATVIIILGNTYKMAMTVFLTIGMLKIYFNDSLVRVCINFFMQFIVASIFEIIFVVIVFQVLGLGDMFYIITDSGVKYSELCVILSNITIISMSIAFISQKKVKKLLKSIIEWYQERELLNLIFMMLITMAIIGYMIYQNFEAIFQAEFLLVINIFSLFIVAITIIFFKEKTDKNKILHQYDQLLDYAKTYEKEIVDKSKKQHEYNNQLVVIKEMIKVKDKKVLEYIDAALDTKQSANDWIDKLKDIPLGGLKGLIYYKVSKMLDENIIVYVNISSELKIKKRWQTCEQNLQDISKVLGVYLDNAIEATISCNKKYIVIDVEYIDNSIKFSISNTYKGDINFSKIEKEGYSTKGRGKGYGLSLAKDIIIKNPALSENKDINGVYYVQSLIVETK